MMQSKRRDKTVASLLKMFLLLRGSFALFAVAMVALIIGASINLILPQVIKHYMNKESFLGVNLTLYNSMLLLILLFAIQGIAFFFRSFLFAVIGQKAVVKLREKLFSSLVFKPLEFFHFQRVGDLSSRLNADCASIQDAVSTKLSIFIRYLAQIIIGVVLMVVISPQLSLLIILFLLLLMWISIVLVKKLKALSKELQSKLGEAMSLAEEDLSLIKSVKIFLAENYEINKFKEKIRAVLRVGIARAKVASFFSSFVSFLMNAGIVYILYQGALAVQRATLTTGDLTAFCIYGVIVAVSFAFLSSAYSSIVQASGASERVFSLIESVPKSKKHFSGTLNNWKGDVYLNNVSFSYPNRKDVLALNKLTFNISQHSITALVGPSGSGKSTIVSLILKLYSIKSGDILYGGESTFNLSEEEVRSHIALVPQEPVLFADTILNNIRYGSWNASKEDIYEAIEKAQVSSFLMSLPNGENTFVGERGSNLSAGQKQRIAIARALLKKPKLLILDEATSALDAESELFIANTILELKDSCSILVIAHRLSTIKSSNKVVVLKDGSVLEEGQHNQLVAQNGLYASMIKAQTLK